MNDKYGVAHDSYCYPGSQVLINLRDIRDPAALDAAECLLTRQRIEQYIPSFDSFSLATLQHIHHFLFQDMYAWAGQIRTVDISKGNTRFANVLQIVREADKLFAQLQREACLVDLPIAAFTARLAHYYCELNVIHPFREGNGRAQRILFETLAINAGFLIRWQPIAADEWLRANIAAYHGRLDHLIQLLARTISQIPADIS